MLKTNGIGDTCPLCGAERISLDLYACFLGDHPCDLDEISAALARQQTVAANTAAFMRSLPEKYHWMTVTEPQLTEHQSRKLAAMTPRGFLYLGGDASAGKTHAAVWKAASWLTEGYSAMFIQEQDYFRRLMNSFSGKDEVPDLLSPDILVWDEFGRKAPAKGSDFVYDEVFYVVSQRYAHEKGTLFTSNSPLRTALERLTEDDVSLNALVSRMQSGQAVRFTADENHRKGSAV